MQKQSKPAKAVSSDKPLRAIFASLTPLTEAPAATAQVMRGFSCGDCKATFAFNRITAGEGEVIEPMCPDCGSENTAEFEGDTSFETLTEANAVNVTCHACATQHVFSTTTQAGLDNAINCAVCGTTIEYLDEEGEDDGMDVDINEDPLLNEAVEDDFEVGDDEDIDVGIDPDDDGDAFAAEQEDESGDTLNNAPDDTVEAGGCGTSDDPEQATAGDGEEDLDLVDAIEDDSSEEYATQASFARIGDRIVAFLGDVSVGVLHRKDILASRQEAFDTAAYLNALSSSYSTAGMSNTLTDFGFKRTSVKVSASHAQKLSTARVEAMAEAKVGAIDTRIRKDTTAAMAIAAVGINKGFWNEEAAANPLKVALLREFTQAGFKGAEKIIDRAFAASSDSYFKLVATKAGEIMQMDPVVANSLMTAIASMRYSSGFVTASDEGVGVEDDAEEATSVVAAARNGIRPARSFEAMAAFGQDPSTGSGQKKPSISHVVAEASERLGDRLF